LETGFTVLHDGYVKGRQTQKPASRRKKGACGLKLTQGGKNRGKEDKLVVPVNPRRDFRSSIHAIMPSDECGRGKERKRG